jgi:hypothetical protein
MTEFRLNPPYLQELNPGPVVGIPTALRLNQALLAAFYSVKISSGGSKRPTSGQLKEKRRSSSSLYNGNTVSLKQISSTVEVDRN